jgi:hypothetical protein
MTTKAIDYKSELERAYRALRGLYGPVAKGELDGSEYFIGKDVSVLHDALAHCRTK